MLEEKLVYHCSPTLCGLKPANLISLSGGNLSQLRAEITDLNRRLNEFDVYIKELFYNKTRSLILVYRHTMLEKYIHNDDIAALLLHLGYPQSLNIGECIGFLSGRIQNTPEFPHEIGAFLGYPIWDICGFMCKKEKCKYTGYWCVYHRVDEAKRVFEKYDKCRIEALERIKNGESLIGLCMAA